MINIYPLTIPIYGSLALHGYGIMAALGAGLAYWAIERNFKRLKIMSQATLNMLFSWAIAVSIIGGRLLYLFEKWDTYSHWYEMFFIWQGGFSILGTVSLVSAYAFFVLWYMKIPFFPCLDIVALYLPLVHAFGRLGCLWAGCCFGCPTELPWAICYGGNPTEAPLGLPLHPTQAYSALIFFVLFGILMFYAKRRQAIRLKPGLIMGVYLLGMSSERFFIDFLRNDRSFFLIQALSFHQLCAFAIALSAVGMLAIRRYTSWKHTLAS